MSENDEVVHFLATTTQGISYESRVQMWGMNTVLYDGGDYAKAGGP